MNFINLNNCLFSVGATSFYIIEDNLYGRCANLYNSPITHYGIYHGFHNINQNIKNIIYSKTIRN